jgi:hypothetical protein
MKEKQKSEWNTVCSPIKTDWHFVILMLCLGVLGVTMSYVSRHVGELSERVEALERDCN